MEFLFYTVFTGFIAYEVLTLLWYENYGISEKTHPREYLTSYTTLTLYSLGLLFLSEGITNYVVILLLLILTGFIFRTTYCLKLKQREELNTED